MSSEKMLVLRERAQTATNAFKATVDLLGSLSHEPSEIDLSHDNVKVIAANEVPFKYDLDPEKQQVVVVLRGNWVMEEGEVRRTLVPGDVLKIPLQSPLIVSMITEEIDAKFVYVQFK